RSSFEKVDRWYNMIHQIKGMEDVPMTLVGNQCERLTEREVSSEEGCLKAKTMRCEFIETSYRTGVNVDRAFYDVVRKIRDGNKSVARAKTGKKKPKCSIL
ncbi:Ras GTPase ras2, partial [Haplosporangium sp. Z 767]